jgi:ATP-dependent DNA helicase PIF1
VRRKQIPLRVAYAITIHKSQGATLDCALIDIGASTFEYGQAYVALSRVRDLESLYVYSLVASKIKAHPAVVRFYETLACASPIAPAPTAATATATATAVVEDAEDPT